MVKWKMSSTLCAQCVFVAEERREMARLMNEIVVGWESIKDDERVIYWRRHAEMEGCRIRCRGCGRKGHAALKELCPL